MKLFRYIVPLLLLSFVAQAQPPIKDGAILAEFSVNDSTKVYFSQGNLQYQASTNTWRFAEHQWDFVGADYRNSCFKNDFWIDLFGWGTSGYKKIKDDRYAYFSKHNDIAGTNYDWGVYNAILNGGNKSEMWRTLTEREWFYLVCKRTNAEMLRNVAHVNGTMGLILLPDNWAKIDTVHFASTTDESKNKHYTLDEWTEMESKGAVFLPNISNGYGSYWAATCYKILKKYYPAFPKYYWETAGGDNTAYCLIFNEEKISTVAKPRDNKCFVRLVQDVKK